MIWSVSKPQAKNSRKMTIRAWTKLGLPIPDDWKKGGKSFILILNQMKSNWVYDITT